MSSLPKSMLEFISNWAEILTVGLALGSAFCGVILVLVNRPLKSIEARERQEEQRKFEIELEAQKGETAKAQAELLRLQQQRLPRSIFIRFSAQKEIDDAIAELRGFHINAEILYPRGNAEAHWLAQEIYALLKSGGWKTAVPKETAVADVVGQLKAQPLGVTIVTHTITPDIKDPYNILRNILSKGLDDVYGASDTTLPHDLLRIVVMPKH